MSNETLAVEELRSRVAELPVDLRDGDETASARFEQTFALGSVAIAFGEEDCIYDESEFPGVVYQADGRPATVVVSGDGTILAIDATAEADAKRAVSNAIETLDDLGLIVDDRSPEVTAGTRTVPFALDPPEVETLSDDDEP